MNERVINSVNQNAGRESAKYIAGWFTSEFANDADRKYGYPKNHLPEPIVERIAVKTTFFSSED